MLLDADPLTSSMIALRLKIGVSDKEVIPACRHLVFTDPFGAQRNYTIQTIVEDYGDLPRWGHSRLQIFNCNGKRTRSASPGPHAVPLPTRSPLDLDQLASGSSFFTNNIPLQTSLTQPLQPHMTPLLTGLTNTLLTPPAPIPDNPLNPIPNPEPVPQEPLPVPAPQPEAPDALEIPGPEPVPVPQPNPVPEPLPEAPDAPEIPGPEPVPQPDPIPEIPVPDPAPIPNPVEQPDLEILANLPIAAPAPPRQDRGPAQLTASEEARHSLRLKVKDGAGTSRRGRTGASSGNAIISSFPYVHLTDLELIQLYEISGFSLGSSEEEKIDAVRKLRSLSNARFNTSLSSILSTKSKIPPITQMDIRPIILDSSRSDSHDNNV